MNSNTDTDRRTLEASSQDAQGRWSERSSQTQLLRNQSPKREKKKSKCHGNRKLQRFKRKCRRHGKTEEEINELIQRQNNKNTNNDMNNSIADKDQNKNKSLSKKRKRFQPLNQEPDHVMKSLSQISISQHMRKKKKKTTKEDKESSNTISK